MNAELVEIITNSLIIFGCSAAMFAIMEIPRGIIEIAKIRKSNEGDRKI